MLCSLPQKEPHVSPANCLENLIYQDKFWKVSVFKGEERGFKNAKNMNQLIGWARNGQKRYSIYANIGKVSMQITKRTIIGSQELNKNIYYTKTLRKRDIE